MYLIVDTTEKPIGQLAIEQGKKTKLIEMMNDSGRTFISLYNDEEFPNGNTFYMTHGPRSDDDDGTPIKVGGIADELVVKYVEKRYFRTKAGQSRIQII